jgi:elongation factor P hydroxylase
MAESSKLDKLKEDYMNAMHAMQTGVSYTLSIDPTEGDVKHIRVGINSALCSASALVYLLIEKGIITEEEYFTKLIELTKNDVKDYEKKLSEHYGTEVKLH